jgi:hypothetical protein
MLHRYIFPAMGLAARVAGASKITDDDFYTAALTLSKMVIIPAIYRLFLCLQCVMIHIKY